MLAWTPPHFWALALLLAPHYEAARVPMLPVVRGRNTTALNVLGYSVLLLALTVTPAAAGVFGLTYLVAAIVLGGMLCALAWRLLRAYSAVRAGVLFHFSLLYLALLFVFVAIDAAVK